MHGGFLNIYLSSLVLKVLHMYLSYFSRTRDEISNLISYYLNFFTLHLSFLVVSPILVKSLSIYFGTLYCILSKL